MWMRGIGRIISNHLVVLYKVRLGSIWIKRKEEAYGRDLENKELEYDEVSNDEQLWE